MKTNSRFSRNVHAISDRIWCNKHLRHTTTEKHDDTLHINKCDSDRFDKLNFYCTRWQLILGGNTYQQPLLSWGCKPISSLLCCLSVYAMIISWTRATLSFIVIIVNNCQSFIKCYFTKSIIPCLFQLDMIPDCLGGQEFAFSSFSCHCLVQLYSSQD